MDQHVLDAVSTFAERVRDAFPVTAVVVFGSEVRETGKELSDIDVAVIVDRYSGDYLEASSALFALGRQVDIRIEPVLIDRNRDRSGFLDHVMATGYPVFPVSALRADS